MNTFILVVLTVVLIAGGGMAYLDLFSNELLVHPEYYPQFDLKEVRTGFWVCAGVFIVALITLILASVVGHI